MVSKITGFHIFCLQKFLRYLKFFICVEDDFSLRKYWVSRIVFGYYGKWTGPESSQIYGEAGGHDFLKGQNSVPHLKLFLYVYFKLLECQEVCTKNSIF